MKYEEIRVPKETIFNEMGNWLIEKGIEKHNATIDDFYVFMKERYRMIKTRSYFIKDANEFLICRNKKNV
jgi:hypothetical protein